MRIYSVYIEDFKNLKKFEINLDPNEMNTVLLGQNAMGKSNFIEAIILIFKYLDLEKNPPSKQKFNYKIQYECREKLIKIEFFDNKYSFNITDSVSDEAAPKHVSKKHFFDNKDEYLPKYIFTYYSGISNKLKAHFDEHQKKFYDKIIKEDATKDSVDQLRRLFYVQLVHSYFVLLAFFTYKDNSEMMIFLKKYLAIEDLESILFKFQKPYFSGNKKFDENFMWGAKGLVREFLDELWGLSLAPIIIEETNKETFRDKDNKKKEFLYLFLKDKNALEKLASFYTGGNTELFKALESTYISDLINEVRVRVKKRNVDGSVTFKELSEGEQQLLTVLGLLRFTRDEETLILLDEPDTHLNPLWKWEYLSLLKSVVTEDCTSNKADETTQIILNTHDPLVIGGMDKEQVRVFKRNEDDGKIYVEEPDVSPKGLGVAGILTSDLFGLSTTLDIDTQDKLNRKHVLTTKQIDSTITSLEREELKKLNSELSELGFNKTYRDPLFERFVTALNEREEYKLTEFSEKELEEQDKIAKDILDELLK